jgi:hypothetical protein
MVHKFRTRGPANDDVSQSSSSLSGCMPSTAPTNGGKMLSPSIRLRSSESRRAVARGTDKVNASCGRNHGSQYWAVTARRPCAVVFAPPPCHSVPTKKMQEPPDGLQHLLARARWDADAVRDDLRDGLRRGSAAKREHEPSHCRARSHRALVRRILAT